jgi:hypothetical protein
MSENKDMNRKFYFFDKDNKAVKNGIHAYKMLFPGIFIDSIILAVIAIVFVIVIEINIGISLGVNTIFIILSSFFSITLVKIAYYTPKYYKLAFNIIKPYILVDEGNYAIYKDKRDIHALEKVTELLDYFKNHEETEMIIDEQILNRIISDFIPIKYENVELVRETSTHYRFVGDYTKKYGKKKLRKQFKIAKVYKIYEVLRVIK